MEVDSGSMLSVIFADTFCCMCARKQCLRLQLCGIHLTDFQGTGTSSFAFKLFQGSLTLFKGHCTSLLGLEWFDALGICVIRVHSIGQSNLEAVCAEFTEVFSGELELYTGPAVSFNLNLLPPTQHWNPYSLL